MKLVHNNIHTYIDSDPPAIIGLTVGYEVKLERFLNCVELWMSKYIFVYNVYSKVQFEGVDRNWSTSR